MEKLTKKFGSKSFKNKKPAPYNQNFSDKELERLEEEFINTYLRSEVKPIRMLIRIYLRYWKELLVALIFFVFFLMTKDRRGSEIVQQLAFLKEDTRSFVAAQIDAFIDILVSFFQRQTVICLIEGVMYGTGFWLVGLPYGFLVGFALGVLNLIPFFGSVVCLPIALPLAYFAQGGSLSRVLLVLRQIP